MHFCFYLIKTKKTLDYDGQKLYFGQTINSYLNKKLLIFSIAIELLT